MSPAGYIALGAFATLSLTLLGMAQGEGARGRRFKRLAGNRRRRAAAIVNGPVASLTVLGAVASGFGTAVWGIADWSTIILAAAGGGLVGYRWPQISRNLAKERRRALIIRSVPKMLDVMIVAVEAGLNVAQALRETVGRLEGPLGEEMRRVCDEIWAGTPMNLALARVAQEYRVDSIRGLTNALTRAETYGVGLSESLNDLREQILQDLRNRVETAIAKVPEKLTLVTVAFYLPALLALVVVPSLIRFGEKW